MKKVVLWITIAVVVLALITTGIVFFTTRGDNTENPDVGEQPGNTGTTEQIPQEQLDAKIAEYKEIILTQPQNVEVSLNLARAYAQKGDIPAARQEIDRIRSLMPTEYRIYDTMLEIYGDNYMECAMFISTISPDIKGSYEDKLRKEGYGLYAGYGNTAGNLANDGLVCIDGEYIFYSEPLDGYALYRADLDGDNKIKLSDRPVQDINVVGDTVYFVDNKQYKIYCVKTDGTDEKLLLDIFGQRLMVVGDRLYYVNWGDGCKIYSAKMDGSDNKKEIDISADHIVLFGSSLYYQDRETMESICRVQIDGTGKTQINEANCLYINGAGNYIYYANWGDAGKLYRWKTDNSEEAMPLTETKVGYINVYGDWIYYVDWIKDQNIYRRHISEGTVECVSKDMAKGIFIKDKYVYYYNELDDERLYRMDLDGDGRIRVGQ